MQFSQSQYNIQKLTRFAGLVSLYKNAKEKSRISRSPSYPQVNAYPTGRLKPESGHVYQGSMATIRLQLLQRDFHFLL